jgi:hypothetical protein
MRDRCLQGVETVIEWQQPVSAEGDEIASSSMLSTVE